MRRSILVLAIALALVVHVPVHAEDPLFRVFGNYLESLRSQVGIPGLAAAVVGAQGFVWQRYYGQADVEHGNAITAFTPFHLDGLTQVFTASLVLRCVEEGHLSLDDRVSKFVADSPNANATIAQLLTHTSGTPDNPVFAYNPARLDPLAFALSACSGVSSREMVATELLERLSMTDSVPGADVIDLVPPYEGVTATRIELYTSVLKSLAKPYAVDSRGRPSLSQYKATTLRPASGLISSIDDLAKFDVALRSGTGLIVRPETLAAAWQAPVGRDGQPLPHGLGWFVQTYNGKQVVWQFGVGENASSSLMVTVPSRGLTLILLANSDGLVKPFSLPAGDVIASPFARVFLSTFAR